MSPRPPNRSSGSFLKLQLIAERVRWSGVDLTHELTAVQLSTAMHRWRVTLREHGPRKITEPHGPVLWELLVDDQLDWMAAERAAEALIERYPVVAEHLPGIRRLVEESMREPVRRRR